MMVLQMRLSKKKIKMQTTEVDDASINFQMKK